ncbi:tetratricopeptide repeat protein [Thauera mechernichensis]
MSSAKKIKSTRSRGQSSAVGERFGNAVQPQVPTQDEINEVIRLFSGGQLEAAERHAAALTRRHPGHPFGWKALGGVRRLRGRVRESLEPMKRATRLAPGDAEAHSNLAKTLMDLGQLEAAEASYREAIRLRPEHVVAHLYLGDLLQICGRLNEAEACFRNAIRLKADLAEAHFKLAQLLAIRGELQAAMPSYREAIRIRPGYAEAHCGLGVVLERLEQFGAAEASYREAVRLGPRLVPAHNNLGNAYRRVGQLKHAEECFREALSIDRCYAEAHCNLGIVLKEFGRLRDAEASLREAIRLKPGMAVAHNNLGNVLKDLGQLKSAEAAYREGIRLSPESAELHSNLGGILERLGQLGAGANAVREAIRLKPTFLDARSNLLFSLNYHESSPVEELLGEAREYGEIVSARAQPKLSSWVMIGTKRLRVGFVSGDFNDHPVGYFAEGMIKHLDRERFELYAFSTTSKHDDLTERIKPYFADWVLLRGKDDLEAARIIHQRGIHVLIDLSGHSSYNRLPVFAYKPAPVQASWLGYFASTGVPEMDFFIGDPHVAPECEAHHFTETLWRLPETWLCREPPGHAPAVGALPARANGVVTFGCFGNMTKAGPRVLRLWAGILNQVPGARLFLKCNQLADPQVVKDVTARFRSHGVAPERLILEGPSPSLGYYAAYNRVNMVLDTFPYPGGTTSVDALWMGVPILTLKGERFLSHLGESIAHNAGLPEWIAENEDDYVQKAVKFASDTSALESIRAGLRERLRDGPLFNTKRFAAHFGDAIAQMYSTATSRKA